MEELDVKKHEIWEERSSSIKALVAALVKFQANVPVIPKNKTNPYYKSKYADLADVIGICKPVWTSCDLAVTQEIFAKDTHLVIKTVVMHVSGEYKADAYEVKRIDDPQKQGASVTYGRRHSLQAALGISADEDDDGNAASTGGEDDVPRATTSNRQVPPNDTNRGKDAKGPAKLSQGPTPEPPMWDDEPFPDEFGPQPSQGPSKGGASTHGADPNTTDQGRPRDSSEISDKQAKMFWAVTKAKGWSNEQVRLFLKHVCKIENTSQIKWKEFDVLIKAIQASADLNQAIDEASNRLKVK